MSHRVITFTLYEAFPPEEAQRIWQRLEVHYTSKHGSWLNMAEIEISIFERGCLSKRVKSFDHLWQHIMTLATERTIRSTAKSIGALRVPMLGLRCMISILPQKSNWTD
jgi:hypothetical protein